MTNVEDEIREAHDSFYAALNEMIEDSPRSMPAVWHHGNKVSTTHPMGNWATGWEQVKTSWDVLGKALSDGGVEVTDLQVFVHGDMAYTIGIEHITFKIMGNERVSFTSNTTNIYRRGPNGWKMIHHHPDKAPFAQESPGKPR